ncbi:hypothetical protein Tco_0776282 [Tanacetum coccineum]
MPPKRTSTYENTSHNFGCHPATRLLILLAAWKEAQTCCAMASASNPYRTLAVSNNGETTKSLSAVNLSALMVRKGAVGLIRWFERTEAEDSKIKTPCVQTMVPNNEILLELFIGGLPRRIEGNVPASKPQTLGGSSSYPEVNG